MAQMNDDGWTYFRGTLLWDDKTEIVEFRTKNEVEEIISRQILPPLHRTADRHELYGIPG